MLQGQLHGLRIITQFWYAVPQWTLNFRPLHLLWKDLKPRPAKGGEADSDQGQPIYGPRGAPREAFTYHESALGTQALEIGHRALIFDFCLPFFSVVASCRATESGVAEREQACTRSSTGPEEGPMTVSLPGVRSEPHRSQHEVGRGPVLTQDSRDVPCIVWLEATCIW